MLEKRKKWSKEEDAQLSSIVKSHGRDINWEVISKEIEKFEQKRSAKQCRERWIYHLNPELRKEKWTKGENKELLHLHEYLGSKWKDIAEKFPGRTDNAVKNQFFSLVRRSLRTARKLLNEKSSTKIVNELKPRVLSQFLDRKIAVKMEPKGDSPEAPQNA